MAAKDELGRLGEQLAVDHLARRGLRILDRNWRCPLGEIDIVAMDGDRIVVVEVKTRSGVAFGHPLEAITAVKLARLRRLAVQWRSAHEVSARGIRIDAIGVVARRGHAPVVEHLEGVF